MAHFDLQDECQSRFYCMNVVFYIPEERPAIIKRCSRLIAAAVNNQLDILIELLDSPRWYDVKDREGFNLLHIAMNYDSKEVFDYLLSLPNFPINSAFQTDWGQKQTTLSVAWNHNQYYICRLIENGVDLVCPEGTDIVHLAAKSNYDQVLKLLIERGKDVNAPSWTLHFDREISYSGIKQNGKGKTPLEFAVSAFSGSFEVISILITHGAEPTMGSFEESVLNSEIPHEVQEFFYLFIKDLLLEIEISLEVMLHLAKNESPLFDEVIQRCSKIDTNLDGSTCFYLLGTMKPTYARKILKKLDFVFFEIFENLEEVGLYEDILYDPFNIECLDVMLEIDSQWKHEMIRIINNTESCYLIPDQYFDPDESIEDVENKASEVCCFLLSYGFNIGFELVERVYSIFGYCELFKILFHMDATELRYSISWPRFIYDPKMSLETFLKTPRYHDVDIMKELVHYFHHPKLETIHNKLTDEYNTLLDYPPWLLEEEEHKIAYNKLSRLVKNNKSWLQMPSLVELARNKFRKYFVEKYRIKTSRQFFTVLNSLPISNVYKKIITYETKLY